MGLDYSIGQQQSISTQRVDLNAPRNPAEELIFQRTDVAQMVEASDGSIHYLDANGEPVAVMNPDGSVYMWEAGGWQSYALDDVLSALSHDEPLQSPQSIATEEVASDDGVEDGAMVCQSTPEIFSEDAMMSIADEDRYCYDDQCHMPDYDEGVALGQSGKRFAESAPTSSSSSSAPAAKKKAESQTQSEVADASGEKSPELGTVDYSDEVSEAPLSDSEEDIEVFAGGGAEAGTTSVDDAASSSDIAESVPLVDTSQDFVTMSDVANASDISAMVYSGSDEMLTSDHSTTTIGAGAFGSMMKGGMAGSVESGALDMIGYSFDRSLGGEIFEGMFYRAIVSSSDKPSMSNLTDIDADYGGGVEYSALVMLGDRRAKSKLVTSRAVSGELKSSNVKGRRSASLDPNSQLIPDEDPFSVAYTTSGMGGMPHMSSIAGVLGMADMGKLNRSEPKVMATLEGGDRHRDNPDEQNRDDNSEQYAELFEESEDEMLVS